MGKMVGFLFSISSPRGCGLYSSTLHRTSVQACFQWRLCTVNNSSRPSLASLYTTPKIGHVDRTFVHAKGVAALPSDASKMMFLAKRNALYRYTIKLAHETADKRGGGWSRTVLLFRNGKLSLVRERALRGF